MKVKELLKEVKANRYTYYNVDKETIKQYQKLYSYLKKHQQTERNKNAQTNPNKSKNKPKT